LLGAALACLLLGVACVAAFRRRCATTVQTAVPITGTVKPVTAQ